MGETVPGGRYQGADGKLHDADGNEIGSKENVAKFGAPAEEASEKGKKK